MLHTSFNLVGGSSSFFCGNLNVKQTSSRVYVCQRVSRLSIYRLDAEAKGSTCTNTVDPIG